ncbi:MAG: PHP-associated domain-containing protein [Candidatus Aenigmatarchaeota archaeon]
MSKKQVHDLYRNKKIVAVDAVTGAVDSVPFFRLHHLRNIKWAKEKGTPFVGFSDAKTAKQVGTCTTIYDLKHLDKENVIKKLEYPSFIEMRPGVRSSIEKLLQTYEPNIKGVRQGLRTIYRFVI